MIAPIQVKLPRTLKISEDDERRNRDYQAKNFISKINKEKSERKKRSLDKRKVERLEPVESLLQKMDRIKMNQINLDDLKLIGINLNNREDYGIPNVEEISLPPINRFKNNGDGYVKKNTKKRYNNHIGDNVLF